MKAVAFLALTVTLSACSAKSIKPGAEKVFLSNEKPNPECIFLGEVVGGQGNWWTDDLTSNHAAVQGARNDLRNKAYDFGANYVHIQNSTHSESELGGTTANTIGNAYSCPIQ
jgi:hypothetical protein